MVHRLLIHWRNAQQGEEIPSRQAVFQQDLGEIVPLTYTLRIPDGGGEPEFEQIGDSYSADLPEDLVGKPISEAPQGTLLSQAMRYHGQVLAKKVPITIGGDYTDPRGDTILYRSIILPLSGGGGKIDSLLGAANCKVKD